jgi:hypothetical protein
MDGRVSILIVGAAVIARGSNLPRFSLSMAMSIVPEDARGDTGPRGTGGGGGGGVFRCCSSGKIGGFSNSFRPMEFSMVSSILTVTGEEP